MTADRQHSYTKTDRHGHHKILRSSIGNESVPKIIINDTINLFF